MSQILKPLWVCILFFVLKQTALCQSINTEFGKNRVQYHDDFSKWNLYESQNFITYWYGKGRRTGQAVVQLAEYDHEELQNIIEHRINDKIEIIVYTDLDDLKQSNIGNEEVFEGEAGRTKTIGSKMFVYFDGNHHNLRKQIRKGIAQVYVNAMYSSSSLQEIVQSNVELNVPKWFEHGIVAFAASNWDHLIEDELRELWQRENNKYHDFDFLTRDHPRVAGHSFWNFMDRYYGKSTIANIMYLIRINKKIDKSFAFVLGVRLKDVLVEWKKYYENYYQAEEKKFDITDHQEYKLKNKVEAPVSSFNYSPDGRYLAYVHNQNGKIKVEIQDQESGAEKTIFKSGYRNIIQEPDFNYPLIDWHPNSQELTIVYQNRKDILLRKVFIDQGFSHIEQIIPEEYHRIYNISYVDSIRYVFSASTEGYSDLYLYESKNRTSKILTQDYHDDLDASYVDLDGQKGILFSSNRLGTELKEERLDTILPITDFDLYFMNLDKGQNSLVQLTNTDQKNEMQPILLGQSMIVYLDDQSGVNNSHVLNLGTEMQYAATNINRNIIRHDINPSTNEYIYNVYDEGAYKNYLVDLDWGKPVLPYVTQSSLDLTLKLDDNTGDVAIPFLPTEPEEKEEEPFQEGFMFQSKFGDPKTIEPLEESFAIAKEKQKRALSENGPSLSDEDIIEFNQARIVASRTKFKLEEFTTRLDNSVLFEGLESYTQNQNDNLLSPNMGILFKGRLKDLFEDYEVEGGVRIPTNFRGSEYFLVFDNNKNLIDKRFALYRKSEKDVVPNFLFPSQETKRVTMMGLFRATYPLDVYTSFKGTLSLREDKYFYLHSNDFSVDQPRDNQKRISLKAEFVFDNTIDKEINVKHGTRYKAYTEVINRFDLTLSDGFDFSASEGFTTLLGFDARHYVPILKHGLIAFRGAGATSFGSDKMLYLIGGVESAVGGKYDQSISVPSDRTFAYRALAPHLRGFDHNARNGSSFILANTEIRLPIFQLISRKRVRSAFLRSLQLVGFYDVGTAWHGALPGSDDNPINTIEINQPPVLNIKVKYFRDPLIMGYGAGLRAELFGYFMKLDYGWGVESRAVQDPKLYFSVGLDF